MLTTVLSRPDRSRPDVIPLRNPASDPLLEIAGGGDVDGVPVRVMVRFWLNDPRLTAACRRCGQCNLRETPFGYTCLRVASAASGVATA